MNYDKWAKKVMTHLTCPCSNGDKCPEGHCYYAIMHFENGKSLYFTCGRPINIGQSKLTSISSNSSIVEKKTLMK